MVGDFHIVRMKRLASMTDSPFPEDVLDTIIREIVGAERKILLSEGNSATKRNQKVREIIDRRAKEVRS